ncbi:MAG TPA: hypothetical protein VJ022_13310 [Anaerolineales bacterium]|nr:hypothetical protein [Anaerolineales bacterium]
MNSENNIPDTGNDNKSGSWFFTRKIYETKAEKKKDFWIGVGLFFGLNIVLALCSWGATALFFSWAYPAVYPIGGPPAPAANLVSTLSFIVSLLPWALNIGLIIYFAFTRSQIALGMLAGFGFALAIVICFGVILTIACFVNPPNF